MSNTRFISPLYDSTFKALCKNNKTRPFMYKLIKYITNIDLDNYTLYDPEINSGNRIKDYRLDTLFINESIGSIVNVEMYKNYYKDDSIKSFQYVFSILAKSMKSGDIYNKKRVVQVNFNEGYFHDNKDVSSICYKITDESNTYDQEYIKVYDVFLLNYKDCCYNNNEELDAMLAFLQAKSYEEMKTIASGNKEALVIMEELEKLSLEEEFIGVYDAEEANRLWRNTYYNSGKVEGYDEGYSQGEEAGFLKGEEAGIAKTKRETVLNMLDNNIDVDLISKCTGLSIDEIKSLEFSNKE